MPSRTWMRTFTTPVTSWCTTSARRSRNPRASNPSFSRSMIHLKTTRYGWPRWSSTLVRCSATCGLREDSEHLQNEDQEGSPQHRHDPAHDGATRGKSKHAGQPEPQARADDAHHDVGYGAHLRVRLHEDAGQPAHDSSYDQRDDPVHAHSSSIFERRLLGIAGYPSDSTRTAGGVRYWTLVQYQTPCPARSAPGPGTLGGTLIFGQRRVEHGAIGDRGPALALDREGAGARGGGGRLPGVAVALVLDEERCCEDIAGAGGIDFARRPRVNLVALAVDEQERAVAVGGQDAEGHALEPLDHLSLLSADVLPAQEQGLHRLQQSLRRAPDAGHDEPVGVHLPEPALRGRADGAVGEEGGDHRIDLVRHRRQQAQRRVAPVFRHVVARQGRGDRANMRHSPARLVPVLEARRVGRRHGDDLDLGRNDVEREVVSVTGQDADGEPEPVRGDGRVERGAARTRGLADGVEGNVADGDEIRRAHDESAMVRRRDQSPPHRTFTASRSTPPSAARGRASVNSTRLGRLKRAILEPTKSPTCWAV